MHYHMDHYGGFFHDWSRYVTQTPNGDMPYWYNAKVEKSTWDSPTLILTSLIMNGIESDQSTIVIDWDGIEGTPFTQINVKCGPKKNDIKKLYLHRVNKQIFKHNPMQPIPQVE